MDIATRILWSALQVAKKLFTRPVFVAVEHADAVRLQRIPHVKRVVVVAPEQDATRGTALSVSIYSVLDASLQRQRLT